MDNKMEDLFNSYNLYGYTKNELNKPKIATIFISAHAFDLVTEYIPNDIEVRLVLPQKLCGSSNYENAESIRNKLVFWQTKFLENDTTKNILLKGIDE